MPYKDAEAKRVFDRNRLKRRRDILSRYKSIKGCADCGYNEHFAGLEFDHLYGKDENVACIISGNWQKLKEEVFKCEVVCGTCHNIRSYERRMTLASI